MRVLHDIDLKPIKYDVIRTNKKIEYINLSCGFDIESTSTYTNGDKVAYMYIWTMGVHDGSTIWHGRTWKEFKETCRYLQDYYHLNEGRRLVCYIHNLGYEFQFMRKFFDWVDVFSIQERKPLKALCSYGIEFRDSYLLSGYSLENTAKNLHNKTVTKLVGDLDYSLKRNEKTPLSEKELQYCINDVEIILAYINEQIDIYKDITKIPLTNTGRVRKYVRHNCYYTSKNHRKSSSSKYRKYRQLMEDLNLEIPLYKMLKRAFMGGFTHANGNLSGQVIEDVTSIDFTSSYPAVMLAEKYPMSKGFKTELTPEKPLEYYLERYCLVFDVRFKNIQSKVRFENYISESKCFKLKNPIINNGRVYSSDVLYTTITDVDYDIIKQCYDWEYMEVSNVYRFYKGWLPKDVIKSIIELYQKKTELKGVEGSEVEYMLSKGMLNSVYGMTVTDIIRDEIEYTNGWSIEPADEHEQMEKYNKSKSRFLYYPWGIWVTAYARRNLWTGIMAIQDDYIYSDTDSIKLKNYDKHKGYIDWYNNNIIEKMKAMCRDHRLNFEDLHPKTIQGKEKLIGVWDFDGYYKRFKTLGAKRYLVQYEDDKYEMTVSGLSKSNGIKYLEETSKNTGVDVFDLFNDEMYIPTDYTGKNTHTYIDIPYQFTDTDYLGNEVEIFTPTGVHLEKCDFTLSISKQYIDFLLNLSKGYLYKGVTYQ